ncbi:hypothetical protein BAUCODRAFT_382095 [Baudoinia panamericana UAMH 10762]|uniref:Uncharacterized protein n=1 Tax=Baudoinia panamericana (strain UAMH 10762) TaxID=717646 RepID=M2LW03_BAUPA|nr:uncharacterized protein BAUCODRAFT_382095 [Baudoinia panamericana UAMH 10762]EMC98842.1 hypothetical protein BAUCODRAFT_382095 [Baudoinia panamericana UAMH 10762]
MGEPAELGHGWTRVQRGQQGRAKPQSQSQTILATSRQGRPAPRLNTSATPRGHSNDAPNGQAAVYVDQLINRLHFREPIVRNLSSLPVRITHPTLQSVKDRCV